MTNFPFTNEKIEAKNAEIKATVIPWVYVDSTLKMSANPNITKIPKINSYPIILRLNIIGSNNAVKKAPVDIIAKATDTVDILIA
ncbi:hypothetical protein GCM10011412_08350 [Maribacter cobaltidurans]|nr:hypothetical protein GCM10011412_08350 [Maribacter cobaltidurans]